MWRAWPRAVDVLLNGVSADLRCDVNGGGVILLLHQTHAEGVKHNCSSNESMGYVPVFVYRSTVTG
jgi:hypothetical protein